MTSFGDTANFFIFDVKLVETLNTAISVILCSICLFSLTFFQRFFFVCLNKENLNLIAFVSLDLAGQTFSQFRADSNMRKLFFPSCLLTLIFITVCIHILKSNMADNKLYCMNFPATAARFVQKDCLQHIVSKLSLYQKSFICF